VVPYLDSCGADLMVNNTGGWDSDDYAQVSLGIQTVDWDDGGIHQVLGVTLISGGDATGHYVYFIAKRNDINYYTTSKRYQTTTPKLSAELGVIEDRSKATLRIRFWPDVKISDNFEDYVAEIPLNDVSAQASQEFVIRAHYSFQFNQNGALVVAAIDGFALLERDIFTNMIAVIIVKALSGPFAWLGMILVKLFRWLGEIFKWVGDFIVVGLRPVIQALEPFLSAISNILSPIWDLVGYLWTTISTIVADIVEEFITWAGDLMAAFVDWVAGAAEVVIEMMATVFFWLWDAMNLPNVLSWVEFGLNYAGEFITWAVTTAGDIVGFLIDISWLFLVGWWTWAVLVQFARARGNPMEGIANFIDAWFADIVPVEIVGTGITIPQGLVFTLWLIVILPSDFALWTAMGML